jgi:hypothetical protein
MMHRETVDVRSNYKLGLSARSTCDYFSLLGLVRCALEAEWSIGTLTPDTLI